MLNCQQATRLMSEAQERPLSRKEQWALRFHKTLCNSCRRFDTQLQDLRMFARRFSRRGRPASEKTSKK